MSITSAFSAQVIKGTNTKVFSKSLSTGLFKKKVVVSDCNLLSSLRESRGVSEMCCLFNPEDGSKHLTLYSPAGNLIQNFNVGDPFGFEIAREYFQKANMGRTNAIGDTRKLLNQLNNNGIYEGICNTSSKQNHNNGIYEGIYNKLSKQNYNNEIRDFESLSRSQQQEFIEAYKDIVRQVDIHIKTQSEGVLYEERCNYYVYQGKKYCGKDKAVREALTDNYPKLVSDFDKLVEFIPSPWRY